MAKPTPSLPRIVSVAHNIAATQARRTAIAKRIDVLEAEQLKLEEEDANLAGLQAQMQREMDKLSSPSSVQH